MDSEVVLRQFDEMEQKVDRLIEVCRSFEASNTELNNRIEQLEKELQSKNEAEARHNEERNLIRSKIDSLLVRLEDAMGAS